MARTEGPIRVHQDLPGSNVPGETVIRSTVAITPRRRPRSSSPAPARSRARPPGLEGEPVVTAGSPKRVVHALRVVVHGELQRLIRHEALVRAHDPHPIAKTLSGAVHERFSPWILRSRWGREGLNTGAIDLGGTKRPPSS